ncbi:MAG: glycosyltransferase family 39 protein [Terriglobales bacterium]
MRDSRSAAIAPGASLFGSQRCRPWWRNPVLWIVLLAYAIRLAVILAHHTYLFASIFPSVQHLNGAYGFETGSIAAAVARGEGFSSPFYRPTGPTTWIAPVYPYICAAFFKLLGGFTHTAAVLVLCLNSLFSALTAAVIYKIAARISGPGLGLWSAFAWAVGFWFWPTFALWDTSLSALLVALGVLFALQIEGEASSKKWFGFGAFWGVALLTNPALLTVFGLSLAWLYYRTRRQRPANLRSIALAVLACIVVITPWLVRNRIVFGEFVFIRGNFGYEFYLGNHAPLQRFDPVTMHPAGNKAEFAKYKSMGEVAFIADKKREALNFVRQHLKDFLVLTAMRMVWFWDNTSTSYLARLNSPPQDLLLFMYFSVLAFVGLGTALVRRIPAAGLFAVVMLLYPWPYYVTYTQNRYRHAIEPLMVIVSAYFVLEVIRAVQVKINKKAPAGQLKASNAVSAARTCA